MAKTDYELNSGVSFTGAEWCERVEKILTKVAQSGATDDELDELRQLARFRNENASRISNWANAKFLSEDDIADDFARNQAADKFPGVDWDRWPFTLIDWDEAADQLRDELTSFEWPSDSHYSEDYSYIAD